MFRLFFRLNWNVVVIRLEVRVGDYPSDHRNEESVLVINQICLHLDFPRRHSNLLTAKFTTHETSRPLLLMVL